MYLCFYGINCMLMTSSSLWSMKSLVFFLLTLLFLLADFVLPGFFFLACFLLSNFLLASVHVCDIKLSVCMHECMILCVC